MAGRQLHDERVAVRSGRMPQPRAAVGRLAVLRSCAVLARRPAGGGVPGRRGCSRRSRSAPGVYAFISPETSGPIPSGNVVAIVGTTASLVVDSGRFPDARAPDDRRDPARRPTSPCATSSTRTGTSTTSPPTATSATAFPEMAVVTTDFTRRKMVEKQIPYLKDLVKTDARLRRSTSRAPSRRASAATARRCPTSASATSRARSPTSGSRSAELAGVAAVDPEPDLRPGARGSTSARARSASRFSARATRRATPSSSFPTRRSSVTGDLLVSPVPYGYGCHPAAWIETLDVLMASDATAIVPGPRPGHARLELREESLGAARGGRAGRSASRSRRARRSSRRRSAWTSRPRRRRSPATASSRAPPSTTSSCARPWTAPTRRRRGRWRRSRRSGEHSGRSRPLSGTSRPSLPRRRAASAERRRSDRQRGRRDRESAERWNRRHVGDAPDELRRSHRPGQRRRARRRACAPRLVRLDRDRTTCGPPWRF